MAEPIILGGVALAVGYGLKKLADRKKNKQQQQSPAEVIETGFSPFSPELQQKAWYMATSAKWAPGADDYVTNQASATITDKNGRQAFTFRGTLAAGDQPALRAQNDAWIRDAMAKGYRAVVSDRVVYPDASAVHVLAFVPDGFMRGSLPAQWGPLMQLFAPPPAYGYGTSPNPPNGDVGPPGGGGLVPPGAVSPFSEIQDPSLRAKVQELYTSETVGLADLEDTAKQLDAVGYTKSAAALRERRSSLMIKRKIEAQQRGGFLYVVRTGDIPIEVAQHYGGARPKVLSELAAANPAVSANSWKGWVSGAEILLPVAWGDPSLKPLPPIKQGKAPGTQNNTTPGGGTVPSVGGHSFPPKPTTPLPAGWDYFPQPGPTGIVWVPTPTVTVDVPKQVPGLPNVENAQIDNPPQFQKG